MWISKVSSWIINDLFKYAIIRPYTMNRSSTFPYHLNATQLQHTDQLQNDDATSWLVKIMIQNLSNSYISQCTVHLLLMSELTTGKAMNLLQHNCNTKNLLILNL
jgi:hypothetical protein